MAGAPCRLASPPPHEPGTISNSGRHEILHDHCEPTICTAQTAPPSRHGLSNLLSEFNESASSEKMVALPIQREHWPWFARTCPFSSKSPMISLVFDLCG
ncbi:hypothetical protein L484_026068 [Morus notabilis]|uniref:Uncharacterized protein n=1 Tax=Morus notabilis TaxID=981085 RepID=W9R815_9ROSA|nr:hypothetical protein L484_026068 [Morus notabilis]